MSIRLPFIPQYSHQSAGYSFSVLYGEKTSTIDMNIHNGIYTTDRLPHTVYVLQEHLPGIFSTDCFNDENLPFRKEVENTELAHLFEHILLEYLCVNLMKQSDKKVVVNGVTTWNWRLEPMGTYHINIDSGIQKKKIITSALQESVKLFDTILYSNTALN